MAMVGVGLSSAGQIHNALNSLHAPRPLGFVERASGLAIGLEGLERRLESLVSRIEGHDNQKAMSDVATPTCLGAQLADAESRLRACMSIVDDLHNRF